MQLVVITVVVRTSIILNSVFVRSDAKMDFVRTRIKYFIISSPTMSNHVNNYFKMGMT